MSNFMKPPASRFIGRVRALFRGGIELRVSGATNRGADVYPFSPNGVRA